MWRQQDRGAAAVEFALVAVLLIVLLFGILEGGRLWMIQSSLSQAAREGVREMAVNGTESAEGVISDRTSSLGGGVTVMSPSITPTTCTSGDTAEVVITASVDSMTGLPDMLLPLFGGGSSFELTGKARMRCGG